MLVAAIVMMMMMMMMMIRVASVVGVGVHLNELLRLTKQCTIEIDDTRRRRRFKQGCHVKEMLLSNTELGGG